MQVCTSLQTDNHVTQFLQAGCPYCCPTNSFKALKAFQVSLLNRLSTNRYKMHVMSECWLMMMR